MTSLRAVFDTSAQGPTHVALAGSIDENADLEAIFSRLTDDTVLNMQHVERVNSMGVHRWIPIVTRFSAQHRLAIDEISYALVQNANAVANLFGGAQVRSCMAPYYCSQCKDNCTIRVTMEEVAGSGDAAPVKRCAKCSQPMEFDELDGYFGFFKARPRR
jgi:hypothetical protein